MLVANPTTRMIVKILLRPLLLLSNCMTCQYDVFFLGVDITRALLERHDRLSTKTVVQKFTAATLVKICSGGQ
jgi:hypothetical protein